MLEPIEVVAAVNGLRIMRHYPHNHTVAVIDPSGVMIFHAFGRRATERATAWATACRYYLTPPPAARLDTIIRVTPCPTCAARPCAVPILRCPACMGSGYDIAGLAALPPCTQVVARRHAPCLEPGTWRITTDRVTFFRCGKHGLAASLKLRDKRSAFAVDVHDGQCWTVGPRVAAPRPRHRS